MDEERKGGLRILRQIEVIAKLGLSHSKLVKMVADGVFPPGFQVVPGGRAMGWLEGVVDEWIMDRSNTGERCLAAPPEPEESETT